jgi:hypothetical protein
VVIASSVGFSFLVISSPQHILAQGSERVGQPVPVFKASGAERSTLGVKPPPAATALNALDLKNLIGSNPGSIYVTLSPRDPSVVNHGALVFVTPTVVEGGENYVIWGKPSWGKPKLYYQSEADKIKEKMIDAKMEASGQSLGSPPTQPGPAGWVMLWLKSSANRKYLIDCAVGGSPFLVSGPAGDQMIQLNQPTGHLNFVLEAATAGWYSFRIASGNEFGWAFYSCAVTNL